MLLVPARLSVIKSVFSISHQIFLLRGVSIFTTTASDIVITPDDRFLYITDLVADKVRVDNITDPTNPMFVGSLGSGGSLANTLAITPDPAPLAAFTATPTTIQTFLFDAGDSVSPVGSIASYDWNFGDATMGSGVQVTHTYAVPGTYSVTLTVTNTAGTSTEIIFPTGQTVLNDGGPSAITSQMITVCPPTATITSLSPTSGPPGTEVTLTGTNLTDIREVFFGTVPGGIVSQNGTSFVAIAPAGFAAGTSVTVSVVACNGTTVTGPSFLFTSFCPPTPTITGISPTSGPAGTEVTIKGTNLTDIQQVLFGTISGKVVSQNGTFLVAIAPAGIAAGTSVTVSIVACNGTTVTGPKFLFTSSCPPTPTITGISPTSGPAGTQVTMTGTNLTDIQQVLFGTVSGEVVNQNGTFFVAIAPAGIAAGTSVTVSIVACNGITLSGPSFLFTSSCPPTPTITGISPTSGPAGTQVTMTGTNLTDIQQVLLWDGFRGSCQPKRNVLSGHCPYRDCCWQLRDCEYSGLQWDNGLRSQFLVY